MEPTNCEFSLLVRTRGHVYVDLLRRSITWMFHEDFQHEPFILDIHCGSLEEYLNFTCTKRRGTRPPLMTLPNKASPWGSEDWSPSCTCYDMVWLLLLFFNLLVPGASYVRNTRVLLIRDKSFSLIQACLCFVFVFASVCEYLAFSSVSTWFAGMSPASVVLIEEEAPALLQMKQVLMQSPSGTTETPLNWSALFTMLMLMLLVIGKEGWKQTRPV